MECLVKRQKAFQTALIVLPAMIAAAAIIAAISFGYADTVDDVVDAVMKIVQIIAVAVGAIFVLVGIVKFAMAHANEDGPAQQKAILMLAAGIVLVLVGTIIIGTLDVAGWIKSVV